MELYRKVYIKSEDDLPKGEFGNRHWGHTKSGRMIETDISWTWRVHDIDWYLQPIDISDADIEAWAENEIERQRKGFKAMNDELPISFDSWMAVLKHCKIISAKDMRDGLIKKIEK